MASGYEDFIADDLYQALVANALTGGRLAGISTAAGVAIGQ